MNVADLSGNVYGELIVLGKDKVGPLWKTKCSCGATRSFPHYGLRIGKHKTCGSRICLKKIKSIDPKQAVINLFIHYVKKSAKYRGIKFLLKNSDVESFIFNHCYYCGAEPSLNSYGSKHGIKINGLDRIDSKKDYYIQNIRTCCTICNKLKLELNESDFFLKIKTICEIHNKI